MATYKIVPLGCVDAQIDTASGALLVTAGNVPGVSGNFLATSQATPAAGAAVALTAVAGVKKVVVSPLVNDDGTPFNTKVVYLRHNAANTAAGIPILPAGGSITIYVSDLTKVFVKTIHTGDGINVAAFDG